MIKKIDHVVLTTDHLEACLAFYEGVGFTSRRAGGRCELYAGDFKINVHIKGQELLPHARVVHPGSGDLCFEITEDLVQFQEELSHRGIEVMLGIVDRTGAKGGMQSLYLRDPDGNLVEFCSYK